MCTIVDYGDRFLDFEQVKKVRGESHRRQGCYFSPFGRDDVGRLFWCWSRNNILSTEYKGEYRVGNALIWAIGNCEKKKIIMDSLSIILLPT